MDRPAGNLGGEMKEKLEMVKALNCLYIVVESLVAEDVKNKVLAYTSLLEKKLEEAEARIDILEKANALFAYEFKKTRAAVLEELKMWVESQDEILIDYIIILSKLRSMREGSGKKTDPHFCRNNSRNRCCPAGTEDFGIGG
jgi:tRNA nucleotidyltransferase/poly(A) polymerase